MSDPYGSAGPAGDPHDPAEQQVPVCPRHPDRVSYVRCQRCGRPTCPECQRTAAVGVHCVDCVREASRAAPQARTAFGAPLRQGAPVVTFVLIGLNVASFLLQQVLGGRWTYSLALLPSSAAAEPWTLLTSAFLHSGIMHIAFNMYALWWLGQYLETALGRSRFLAAYLVSALGGSTAVVLVADPMSNAWNTYVLGASGAVFGLFGLVLVVLRRLGRSARAMWVLLAINVVIGFVVPNVAWQAHLGGLVTGALIGLAYAYAPKQWRAVTAVAAPGAVTAALVVLAALKLGGA